jgi:hypothetical protein
MNAILATVSKLVPCILWGSVAISSATPADASIVTTQTGPYAACSQNYEYRGYGLWCGGVEYPANYIQRIKLVWSACSSGGCSPDWATVYTENLYTTGRHVTTRQGGCSIYNVYGLGSCAC